MNCANHADASAVAYCRTCGKALCASCTRPVRGVIYCEDCLGAKMEGASAAAPGFVPNPVGGTMPGTTSVGAPTASSGPNPTVAGILAGFFPFGVGAVYTGQYAKGLAHLAIMAALIGGASASDHSHSEMLGVICGFRSSTQFARPKPSRWHNRFQTPSAWPQPLAVARKLKRAKCRWVRSS
jgi:hypothetical protein